MGIDAQKSVAQQNAETTTNHLLSILDESAGGSRDLAMIYGNSAIAAVVKLYAKYGITPEEADPSFQALWAPQLAA